MFVADEVLELGLLVSESERDVRRHVLPQGFELDHGAHVLSRASDRGQQPCEEPAQDRESHCEHPGLSGSLRAAGSALHVLHGVALLLLAKGVEYTSRHATQQPMATGRCRGVCRPSAAFKLEDCFNRRRD